jgi:hypothetical protein
VEEGVPARAPPAAKPARAGMVVFMVAEGGSGALSSGTHSSCSGGPFALFRSGNGGVA